ncbi:MAG: hypothetical protein QOE00_1222 [Ilumatobacteraceae bacterium]
MNDFESHLSVLLDDVASSVHPHPDPDSVFLSTVPTVSSDVHRFRPRFAAVAAAGIVLVGGSAFAMERITHDPPTRVSPAASPIVEPTDAPTTTRVEPATTIQDVVTTTIPKETVIRAVVVVDPTVPSTPPTEPTVPPTEPSVAPVVVEFTAKLGADGRAKTPMTQGFYGNAQPGSAIHVVTQFGVADTTANGNGKWETTLTMGDVPAGTKVAVRITSSTSDRVREFTLERPAPAPPPAAVIEFTAFLGTNGQANTPMTQGFYGNAQPGSAIRISSDWGVAEAVAGANGIWGQTIMTMGDVPAGTAVHVRITSSTSDRVREFTLQRPGTTTPPSIDFTANAGWSTTDATPPVDEYSGNSTAGAVITISSPYGGGQVQSNAEGHWSARVEFPDAPVGVTFNVHVVSSKGTATYDFPLTRVAPA